MFESIVVVFTLVTSLGGLLLLWNLMVFVLEAVELLIGGWLDK